MMTTELPFESAVACGCDPRFHLPLAMLLSPDSEPVHACVRCGHITCTEVLWTHVHHNTYDPHGRREYAVTEETRAWLDLWPRVLRGNNFDDYAFLPATGRCTETLWELSQRLTPERDAALLLNNARPMYRLSSALAIDALLQRADLPEILARASAGADYADRETACAIVREDPATLPLALPGLLASLDETTGRPGAMLDDHRLHSLLDFFAAQKIAAAQIVPALEAIKARVSRHAFEFSRKLTETIRTLNGEPPLLISRKPWFFN